MPEQQRLLVVGDFLWDVDHHCVSERDGILRELRSTRRPGGAGAVAEMARGLGAICNLASHVQYAEKHRYYVDGKLVGHRFDVDAPPMGWAREQSVCDTIANATADRILLSDYGQGTCTDKVIAACMATGKPVFVDPCRGKPWSRYDGATLLKCNLQQWFERPEQLFEKFPYKVTTTNSGLTLTGPHAFASWYNARPSNCIDATGCGDMVLAALGVAWPLGVDFACRFAMACAGLKCERPGAVPVSPVVMVNGCFDTFTEGHRRLLTLARQIGGVLVAAINSDASVRERKGADRPRHCQAERVAALRPHCDVVEVFDTEEQLEQIIQVLHPVMVKGSDWKPHALSVTGADFVKEMVWVERV